MFSEKLNKLRWLTEINLILFKFLRKQDFYTSNVLLF